MHSLCHQLGTLNNTVLINICQFFYFLGTFWHVFNKKNWPFLARFGPGRFFGKQVLARPGPGQFFGEIFWPGPGRKIFGPTHAYFCNPGILMKTKSIENSISRRNWFTKINLNKKSDFLILDSLIVSVPFRGLTDSL